MDKIYAPRELGKLIGRTTQILQLWDRKGLLKAHRTPTNRRCYTHDQYLQAIGQKAKEQKIVVYCRVSSAGQKVDLESQKKAVEQFCIVAGKPVALWLQDIGSGLNYKRKNFVVLMEMVEHGEVSEIVTAHQDRLVRFGYEWFEKFCRDHGTTLTMMNAETLSPEQEMTQDLLSIIHCFSSRLYGLRKYKKQIMKMAEPRPMRTIKRISRPLNYGKWNQLVELARRYAAEKQVHLAHFSDAPFAASGAKKERARRDELVQANYRNRQGLQARQWKMAEKDAYETVDRQWAALAIEMRPLVMQHTSWSEAAHHYAFWLLKDARRLAELVSGKAPLPTHFSVAAAEQKTVRNYLRRVIRRKRGAPPAVKKARSFCLDANMYTVFEQAGTQFISVMSLTPRQRIVIPLTGATPILGNVRLVLDFEQQRVEVHYTAEVKTPTPLTGEPCGLDAGLSEVFTDEKGTRYVPEFGEVIRRASDEICDKGRKRNKLFQLAKKAEAKGDPAKARRIRKFNLGRKKLRARQRRQRAEMERLINTAIRQVARERRPQTIATEKLDIRGKAQSKKISRRVSQWTRSILKERTEFLASVEGFHRQQVNPAYTSQTCPNETCGFVHAGNRRGDTFQCLYCGHADVADRVAAHNLKARLFDSEITLWTPKERVKKILLDRFNARLEREGRSITNPTVSGRTPGTPCKRSQPESETPTAIGFGHENGGAKCV